MKWTVFAIETTCGHCGGQIQADHPVALLTVKNLVRCQACVDVPVNEQEVDNERFRIERERLAGDARQVPERERYQPVQSVPFDAKMAQSGERDE